jgi:murein hydrolase activator
MRNAPATRRTHRMLRSARWAGLLLFTAGAPYALHTAGARGQVSTDIEVAALLDSIEVSTAKQERFSRETADLAGQRSRAQHDLRAQIRALYRVTRAGSPLAGGMDAVLRHVARVKRLQQLIHKQAGKLVALDGRARSLRTQNAEAGQTLERSRARLSALQAGPAFGDVLANQSDYRAPAGEMSNLYGVRVGGDVSGNGFANERGSLASPVTGEVRIQPGQRSESDGPGLEFQAPVGTAVRAVASGRVAFSDRYGSYGRLVILDHGDGYYTVYGGLGSVEVRVGDDLSRNARLGSIGTDFTPSALFFEVRKGTRTLEPRAWLGI